MDIKFDYYYGKEAETYSFLKIPKLLFTDPIFSKLSSDAKLVYGILLDRMSLSIKNGWVDEENRVYIIFTIEEIAEMMYCATQKATKILQELDDKKGLGLIEKKRLGLGKPNIIYVKNFIIQEKEKIQEFKEKEIEKNEKKELQKSQFKNCENHNSRNMKITIQELWKSQCNKTNNNKTDYNNTNLSINQLSVDDENDMMDMIDYEKYKNLIHTNFDYTNLEKTLCKFELEQVDQIVELMLDIILSKQDKIKVGGDLKPKEIVKKRFLLLKYNHIKYVLKSIAQNSRKAKNIRSYLITCLFNAYSTESVELDNQISADFNFG